MTQEKLGEEIDMTSGGLSQLENGVVNYTQPTLEAIAKALTCAPGTLLLVEPTVKSEDGIRLRVPTDKHLQLKHESRFVLT